MMLFVNFSRIYDENTTRKVYVSLFLCMVKIIRGANTMCNICVKAVICIIYNAASIW